MWVMCLEIMGLILIKPGVGLTVPKPKALEVTSNKYETGQSGLCGHFSHTEKASLSQYQHLQGEISAIKKLNGHYH